MPNLVFHRWYRGIKFDKKFIHKIFKIKVTVRMNLKSEILSVTGKIGVIKKFYYPLNFVNKALLPQG